MKKIRAREAAAVAGVVAPIIYLKSVKSMLIRDKDEEVKPHHRAPQLRRSSAVFSSVALSEQLFRCGIRTTGSPPWFQSDRNPK